MACALATGPPDVEPHTAAAGSIVTEPLRRVTNENKACPGRNRVSMTGEASLRTLRVPLVETVSALTPLPSPGQGAQTGNKKETKNAKAFEGQKGLSPGYQRTGFRQEDFDFLS